MTVRTPSGKAFNCDMVSEIPSPPRLYLHLTNTTVNEVMLAVSGEDGLPIIGYEDFRYLQSVSTGPFGVNLALKKTPD